MLVVAGNAMYSVRSKIGSNFGEDQMGSPGSQRGGAIGGRSCPGCGTVFAADNTARLCGRCHRDQTDQLDTPPQLDNEFFETDEFRAAFESQHIGKVFKAYRNHPRWLLLLGKALSQELLGHWIGVSQGHVSKLETLKPEQNFDALQSYAITLHLPPHLLWFKLPGQSRLTPPQLWPAGAGQPGQVPEPDAAHWVEPRSGLQCSGLSGKESTTNRRELVQWGGAAGAGAFVERLWAEPTRMHSAWNGLRQDATELGVPGVESGVARGGLTGQRTLEQWHADIRRIVTQYPHRPVYPLFVEVRSLGSHAFDELEGRQSSTPRTDHYLVTGVLCGVLANASFDLGRLDDATAQARTAFLCAELAGCNWLRAWLRGTQALIAYWDDRPHVAVQLAQDGRRYVPESGTALVRLAAIEARAYGQMHDANGVNSALGVAADARAAVIADDDLGGMMAFPEGKQSFYVASARLWLGGQAGATLAERDAEQAVRSYEQDPPRQRRVGELNLARLDLATARLALGELESTAAEVRTVLEVASRRPTESVGRRLRQVDAVLAQPRYRNNHLASDLRDQIGAVVGRAALPAFPGSDLR